MKGSTWIFTIIFCLSAVYAIAQENIAYQVPDDNILELVDAPLPPRVLINDNGDYAILAYRNQFKSIEEMSAPELRLGGLRINPGANIYSRQRYYYKIEILDIGTKQLHSVVELPSGAQLSYFSFSPDQQKLAFTNTKSNTLELWVLDLETREVTMLVDQVNANLRSPFQWEKNSAGLLVKVVPDDRKELVDQSNLVPTGPTISVNEGKKAQNRTYQDLLKNKYDEFNFRQLATSQIMQVRLDGQLTEWMEEGMYMDIDFSPDGQYVLVDQVKEPFSYLVPYYRFPFQQGLYDASGNLQSVLLDVPLIEDLPKGFMAVRTGKRSIQWRNDQPSSLVWFEALDKGDPENEVMYRDALYEKQLPEGQDQLLLKVRNRLSGVDWGSDQLAIAYDYWWNNRNTITYAFNPSDPQKEVQELFNRNYQDRYSDPGEFVTVANEYNEDILAITDNALLLMGDGYSDKGIYPFVDQLSVSSWEKDRLWEASDTTKYERLMRCMDPGKGLYLTSIEAKSEYPNYFIRNISTGNVKPITEFENPFVTLQNVKKELITYQREDGLSLSANLYLPTDYEPGNKYPMLLWAYPREYKDKSSASQVTNSPNEFTYPYYGSPIYWVTRGYVVLEDAAFPIIGEEDEEPNDSFVKQLVGNARAAITAVDERGFIDPERVGVGGHSYGAFMTANLLSHSNLFAAGIARSGAYNRTLTPFGFQSEQRTYWEAPEIYYNMSPFMHADKMKTPLLLLHGEADNNSGTYPMQSQRYFNALKGLGATVRLVMLPKESHGYAARESILHMLWEQDQWLEKYVKNKKKSGSQKNDNKTQSTKRS